tara:strand:+ start:23 stop:904 length:882 start_codon:yes stop_codon:yes gene_type:complete
MNKNFLNLRFFFGLAILGFVQSCETIMSIPSSVVETSSKAADYVGSIFEDEKDEIITLSKEEDENNDIKGMSTDNNNLALENEINEPVKQKEKSELSNESELNNTNISDYDQVLEAVPAEDLKTNELTETVTTKSARAEINQKEDLKVNSKKKNLKNKEFSEFNFESPELKLKNKIQFRIATINFTSGSSSLKRKDIKKIKDVMQIALQKNAIVKIVGHASTRTKDLPEIEHKLVNFNISDKRSQSVAKIFVDNNFPIKNLITEAVSDSKPIFLESMPAGTNRNQRTEIFIIY